VRIEVCRGAGDAKGADVEAPLLNGLPALIERGRVEMDKGAHQKIDAEISVIPLAGVRLGALAEYQTTSDPGRAIGKVVGISIVATGGLITQRLNIERVDN
jgi:hypothetical protein